MSEQKEFRLGVTMAGAVSAGAYTAGVLDVLFSALAAQGERENAAKVILKAISGTSAGGVCSALSVPTLLAEIVDAPGDEPGDPRKPALPLLHKLWVEEIDMMPRIGDDGRIRGGLTSQLDLQEVDDTGKPLPILSVLDSAPIEIAAKEALKTIEMSGRQHPWVATELDIFVTCTNLTGVPYEVPFGPGDDKPGHRMANHAYVAHFRATGIGTTPIPSPWLTRWHDSGIALRFSPEPGPFPFYADKHAEHLTEDEENRHALVEMGLVTGAFPLGLSARTITSTPGALGHQPAEDDPQQVTGGAWPLEIDPQDRANSKIRAEIDFNSVKGAFHFLAVDGGVCNNEPFELARYTLRGETVEDGDWKLVDNPREPEEADRAVIMIDPFPEGPEDLAKGDDSPATRALTAVLSSLQTALVDQARFKPGELVAAMSPDGRSRFLIAPSRVDDRGNEFTGAEALASGFLGGFGGFFDEAFREHDYQLGRHNAQRFLKAYFKLAPNNLVFKGTPAAGAEGDPDVAILAGNRVLETEIPQPEDWPMISTNRLHEIFEAVERRVDAVKNRLVDGQVQGWLPRQGASLAWYFIGKKTALRIFQRMTLQQLIARSQLKEAAGLQPHERAVLAAFFEPGPDLRSAAWLQKTSGRSATEVKRALEHLQGMHSRSLRVWEGPKRGGVRTYALLDDRPSWWTRSWGIGSVSQFLVGKISSIED
ncbi:MAG: hypothetical protein AAFV49_18975 [Pseudomonadota bacterium]